MAIDAKAFQEALAKIEEEKGVKSEAVIEALKEAIVKGYKKQLGADDAIVEIEFDLEKGLNLYNIKKIVEDVQDDVLEIELDDAKVYNPNYKIGDDCYIPATTEDLRKATALSIKSVWKQKFAEAEKEVVKTTFANKMHTMVTGRVEKVDDRGVTVSIGKNTVFLSKKQMIGDEIFRSGDPIRIYVAGIDSSTKSGARINVTRADEGFLKVLFNEEIREIYDGTIEIKGIAREAGDRSKVAVYSANPDVDPSGSCIGQNGSRIQKIVSQLGNGVSNKEKIDIIAWSENPGLYIMESLKPAKVAGIVYDEVERTSTAIVEDESYTNAIGRHGVNVRLASKLTGYRVNVIKKEEALEKGVQYKTFEELNAIELEKREKAKLEARLAQLEAIKAKSEILPGLPEGYVAPQERVYEDEANDFDEVLNERVEEETIVAPVEEVKEKVEAKPVETKEEQKEEKVEVKSVKTTTTLSDLEKSLEDSSKKNNKSSFHKSFKKKSKDEEEEEETKVVTRDPSQNMSIYTEEELREFEAEDKESDEEYEDEDVDYDEYDDYYDQN